MATGTRDRILAAASTLLRRQGYNATGVKQVIDESGAAFGSLYHFFPAGKEELGAEAVMVSSAAFERLLAEAFDGVPDAATGVRRLFAEAARQLVDSGYAEGSAIATVALETANSSERVREACAAAFERWLTAAAARIAAGGAGTVPGTQRTPGNRAVELAVGVVAALEGALVLARTLRSTEPLRIAGELVAQQVDVALARP